MIAPGVTGVAGETVIWTALLVAVVGEAQTAFDVITTVTLSPLFRVVLVKVGLFVPTSIPFTFHWYDGVVPPFVGVAVKVTEALGQMVVAEAAILTDGTGAGLTVMAIPALVAVTGDAQVALDVITTVTLSLLLRVVDVKVGLFVPTFEPFTLHWYTGVVPPFTGVAVNVTDVPGQIVVWDATTDTDGTGAGFTVMLISVLVAEVGEAQVAFDVSTTVTLSLLLRVVDENVGLFVPTFTPLTLHWYTGADPPLIAVAVKVTEVPGQIVVAEGATVTEGVTRSFAVIVSWLLVTTAGEGQTAFDVISTVTLSVFARVLVVKVGLFVPTFTPFTFHW